MHEAVATPGRDQTPSNAVMTSKEVAPVVLDTTPSLVAPAVSAVPAMFADQVQTAPVVAPTTTRALVAAPPLVLPEQMSTEDLLERDKANIQNTPAVPVVATTVDPYRPETATRRADFITDPVKAAMKVRSISEIVEELSGKQKTEKSFTDSLANLFTASGFKEELGLNNQDIIRMAISTAVGAKKFGVNRALAYAGKQAFEESSKRNLQRQAEEKAIRTAAVQIRGQELRDVRAMENETARDIRAREDAAAREKRDVARENARAAHAQFMANQQLKMAEIKDEYNRSRDASRFEQQMRVLASQQVQQDKRMQAMFGNQWAMLFAREDLRNNSPIAQLDRLEKHTEKAASAISEIYKRDLGPEDVKDQINPLRSGLPTPKQSTQQSLSYLKRSGFDITNPDAAQEATAIINQATEQMIADKKSGRVKEVKDITPYLARNVISSRLGLEENMFTVGKDNKPMPPEKMTEIFSMVRGLTLDADGKADIKKQAEIANRIAKEWNGPNGKQYSKEFRGTDTESAYAQFMKAQLKKLSDK